MRVGWFGTIGLLLLATGCRSEVFFCQQDHDCLEDRTQGACQNNGLCSFPDTGCASGQRYGDHAGSLGGECVDPAASTGVGTGDGSSDGGSTGATDPTLPAGSTEVETSQTEETTSATSTTTPLTTGQEGSTSTGFETNPDGAPLGTPCVDGNGCQTGLCVDELCSECASDADCTYGCTPSSPYLPGFDYGRCNDGQTGDACQTTAACVNATHCTPFLITGGEGTPISTCSSCGTDQDCAPGQTCGIEITDDFQLALHRCLEVESSGYSSWCDIDSTQCSGHCKDVEFVEGPLGICGECIDANDCPAGGCTNHVVNLETLEPTGSLCQ